MKQVSTIKIGDKAYQVDLRGWMCPYPKYAIEPLLDKLPHGSELNLLVNCPAATGDVPHIARTRGFVIQGIQQIGSGEWQITIQYGR